MAKNNSIKFFKNACNFVMRIGRAVGARRVLFVWSAIAAAISVYFGIVSGISTYNANFIADMNMFVLMQSLEIVFLFLKIFLPIFILIVAAKYIFDCGNRPAGKASETFRLSFWASVLFGILIAALYYLDAGHIIGSNASDYCAAGSVCTFTWAMLKMAGQAFLASGLSLFLFLLGIRGIYTELSFMLSHRK